MEQETYDALKLAADTVRIREQWLDDKRQERDALIFDAQAEGYSLGELAEVTELSKSAVALIVKMQAALRSKPQH